MTKTNILSMSDMRNSTTDDIIARDYINSATDVTGVIYIGDYSGIDCVVFDTNKPGFYVQGNHPGCGKGNPNLFIPNFLNTGIQAAFPAFNYSSFNWSQIDQTKLSMVFVHINAFGRGCEHPVDKTLKAIIDGIKNLSVVVCGHDHGSFLDPRNDRIYYIDPTPPPIQYCGKEPFTLGWLQIDTDTPNKTIFRHAEVDPYQPYKGVPTSWLKEVVANTSPGPTQLTTSESVNPKTIVIGQQVTFTATVSGGTPPYKYNWVGLPTPLQNSDTNIITGKPDTVGTYVTAVTVVDNANNTASANATLIVNSIPPVKKYKCSGAPNYACIEDPTGPYNSLQECQAVCKAPSHGSITVINPKTGLVYTKGNARVIRWTHTTNTGANVKIELLKANKVVKILTSNTPNDGQMAWNIPNVTSGIDYRVKIISKTNAQIFGVSGKFTIK